MRQSGDTCIFKGAIASSGILTLNLTLFLTLTQLASWPLLDTPATPANLIKGTAAVSAEYAGVMLRFSRRQ